MLTNMFEILKITNKELVLSNYFAWLLNPYEGHGKGFYFLNAFLHSAGIETVKDNEKVFVDREYSFKYNEKINHIDILIRFSDKENPSRVICIENKVDSEEGSNQTKRYYEGLENNFSDCKNKQYIYLTRYNSSVELSNTSFIHLKYRQLIDMFRDSHNKIGVDNVPLTADFYNEYIEDHNKKLTQNQQVDLSDKDNFNTLLDGLVNWFDMETPDIFCAKGKSAQSNEYLCVIYKPSWVFSIHGYQCKELSIHLEVVRKSVYLHFEVKPYVPYGKLKEKYGADFFELYNSMRNHLRKKMDSMTSCHDLYSVVKHKSNANLQVALFKIKETNYYSFYKALQRLIDDISPIIQSFKNI